MSFPVPLPSTFMPLPLAIMIPFMGIQSGVMAQQFGMNFQFGKRKISSMSNEEFNKLTPEQMQADFSNQIKGLIPTFGESLKDMRPFQRMIFEEMLAVFKTAVDLGIDVGIAGAEGIAHAVGTHAVKHGEEELPTIDEHKFLSPLQERAHKRHGHLGGETISTPGSFSQPTSIPSVGTTFERTLAQAQADTSASRGTGIIKTEASKRGAGQTQRLAREKLERLISQDLQIINQYKRAGGAKLRAPFLPNVEERKRKRMVQLAALLARYRF